jgi:O-antigen/teichoic acid export membrane protein
MSIKKKFVTDVIFYGLSSTLISTFSFITLPILTKTLSQEVYGIWVQIVATVGLLLTFIMIGLQTSTVRFLSGVEDKKRISALFHMMLGIVLTNCALVMVVTFIFQNELSEIVFADASLHRFIPLTALWLTAQAIYSMHIAILRSMSKIKLLSTINIGNAALNVMLLYTSLVYLKSSIETTITFFIISSITVSSVLYLTQIVKGLGIHLGLADRKKILRDILLFSIPFIPSGALTWVLSSSDRYFIVHMLGLSQNAVYSLAYNLSSFLSLFYVSLGYVVFPLLVRFWEKNDKETIKGILEKLNMAFLYFMIPSIFGLYLLGPQVIILLATNQYASPPTLILWVTLGVLFLGIYQINAYIIELTKKTHYDTLNCFTAASVNIILNYFLIGAIGIEGAAISTCISYMILAAAVSYWAKKEVRYEMHPAFILKCIASAAVMYLLIGLLPINNPLAILAAVIVGGIVYLILTVSLKCFTPEDVKDIKHILGLRSQGGAIKG